MQDLEFSGGCFIGDVISLAIFVSGLIASSTTVTSMSAPQTQDSTNEYWYWAACVNLAMFTLFFLLDKNTDHAKNSMKRLLDGVQDVQIQEIAIECLHRSFIIERPDDLEFMEACFGNSGSAADDSFADI